MVAVCADSGGIYRSVDAGSTWERTSAPATNWSCVACSADGTRLVAASGGGLIYSSTDSGATWMATTAPSQSWYSLASSADGATLVAGGCPDNYASVDSGMTWIAMGPGPFWAVACSADGYRLVGAGAYRLICTWSGDETAASYGSVYDAYRCRHADRSG